MEICGCGKDAARLIYTDNCALCGKKMAYGGTHELSESTGTAGYVHKINEVIAYMEKQYTCGDHPMGSDCYEEGYSPSERLHKATEMLKEIVAT